MLVLFIAIQDEGWTLRPYSGHSDGFCSIPSTCQTCRFPRKERSSKARVPMLQDCCDSHSLSKRWADLLFTCTNYENLTSKQPRQHRNQIKITRMYKSPPRNHQPPQMLRHQLLSPSHHRSLHHQRLHHPRLEVLEALASFLMATSGE